MASSRILETVGGETLVVEADNTIRLGDDTIGKDAFLGIVEEGDAFNLLYLTDPSDLSSIVSKTFSPNAASEPSRFVSAPSAKGKVLQIVVNPQAGDRTSSSFVEVTLIPLLKRLRVASSLHTTASEGGGVDVGRSIAEKAEKETDILLIGGDGTTSEVLNGLQLVEKENNFNFNILILPRGTSNAYYAYLFPPPLPTTVSLLRYLQSLSPLFPSSAPQPFPVIRTILDASNEQTISHVVVSTALHASILHDSEALRSTIPGVERFKQAAMQNWGRFYSGSIQLLGEARIWEGDWRPLSSEEKTINGPFVYATSVLVDRLEPAFVIAPLRKREEDEGTLDLIVMRPSISRNIQQLLEVEKKEEAGKKYGEILMGVFGKAYEGGKHIDITLPEEGTRVVEYFRAEGWEWIPDPNSEEEKDRLVCLDGTIKSIPKGGKARILTKGEKELNQYYVWA
ncbi:hypothetical protein BT69DRAFT_1332850 [Atractiella rhizophila]|nr:hypothetical protein BT69DRAFT_1332850 [Atractiella rhizophila]